MKALEFPTDTPVKIVMLGAGGTGAQIAPNLYRLLYSMSAERQKLTRIIIADGDAVEEKNLVRQHFSRAELGLNKARALAERYSQAFGMTPEYIPDFIEDRERLRELLTPEIHWVQRKNVPDTVILIGAVDNNRSRKLCHKVFMKVYIDSGNGEYTGQVVCGIRRGGRTLQKPVGLLYPDVLKDTDKFPTELSCAEVSVSAPQTITANLTASTIVVNMVYNILVLGINAAHCVSFSTKSVHVKPMEDK